MSKELVGILVARVSTKPQAREDRFSLDSQFRMMRECCERRFVRVADERTEPGRSAFTSNLADLPVLHQTILDIEAGKANCLVMNDTTRLARNEQLGNHILDRLTACGAHFINSMMEIDYTTPEGRVFFNQEVAMAAYSSRKTSQNSIRGKREQFLQGLTIGPIPFGYRAQLNADGRPNRKAPIVIVPEEASAIRKAFEDSLLGKNPHQVAREWNDAAYVVRSTKGLTYWQPQTVRDILRNELYAGRVRHLAETRAGVHEAIVSEELFQAAQRPVTSVRRTKHAPKLLRGVATCVEGHRLYVLPAPNSRRRPDLIHYYYREPSDDKERSCSQSGKLWTTKVPDAQVEALLRTLALDGDWLHHVEDQARTGSSRSASSERADVEMTLERLQDEYLARRMSSEKYEKLLAECHDRLGRLKPEAATGAMLRERLSSWIDLWDGASPETRNETCRLVFEQAVIDFAAHELTLVPWPEFAPLFEARAHYVAQDSPVREKW